MVERYIVGKGGGIGNRFVEDTTIPEEYPSIRIKTTYDCRDLLNYYEDKVKQLEEFLKEEGYDLDDIYMER